MIIIIAAIDTGNCLKLNLPLEYNDDDDDDVARKQNGHPSKDQAGKDNQANDHTASSSSTLR